MQKRKNVPFAWKFYNQILLRSFASATTSFVEFAWKKFETRSAQCVARHILKTIS